MHIEKIADNIYEIPKGPKVVKVHDEIKKFDMLVPARVYANDFLLRKIRQDRRPVRRSRLHANRHVSILPSLRHGRWRTILLRGLPGRDKKRD